MKTSNKILMFGAICIVVVLLTLSIIFRMNSFSRKMITIDMHDAIHHVHRIHHFTQGVHRQLKMSDHVCYVKIDKKNARQAVINLKPFNSIVVGGKLNVIIERGAKSQVKVMAEKKIMPYVKVYEEDDMLRIKVDKKDDMFYKPVNVVIQTNRNLNQINLGGLVVLCAEQLDTNHLQLNIGGKVPACVLKGRARKFSLNVGGNFNIDAKALLVRNAHIRMAGKGDVMVNASRKLEISGFGAGTVRYYGNPRQVKERGFGRITMVHIAKGGE